MIRAVVVSLVLAGCAAAGWVVTPPAVPGATGTATNILAEEDAALEVPALPPEPDDDEDEHRQVRPRRAPRSY